MLNVDTHVLVHAITGELKAGERRLLTHNRWSVSAIVFWELAKLRQLDRIELDLDDPEFGRFLASLHVWPITPAVAWASTRLDVAGDPAGELIAATSVVHKVPLLTRDRRLLRSTVVPLAK